MKNSRDYFPTLVDQAQQQLKQLQASGVTAVPAGKSQPGDGGKAALLEPVREKALKCQDCRLHETRNSVVFGEGSLNAPFVFVGEGPGRDEDKQGRPFVGAAGKLLDKIIEAMGYQRPQVYIANVVKCRPPNNRPPELDEAQACSGYLEAQLTTIAPRVIIALGRTAANALLESSAPMSALRGQPFLWRDIPLVITYHPAYLLRNPSAKKDVWDDMKGVLKLLEASD